MHSKISAVVVFLHITKTSRLLEVLREDNRAVVRAASQASKAADFLLSFLPDDTSASSDGRATFGTVGKEQPYMHTLAPSSVRNIA